MQPKRFGVGSAEGAYAMISNNTDRASSHPHIGQPPQTNTGVATLLLDDWFDPIEARLRLRTREFLQELIEEELEQVLRRPRYAHRSTLQADDADGPSMPVGHRHGHRTRTVMATVGEVKINMPRARLKTPDGTNEWHSKVLPA